MKTIKLFIASVLLAFSSSAQYTWQDYGPNEIAVNVSNPIIDVYNSEPYIVYKDANADNKLFAKKYDGTNWVNVGAGLAITDSTVNSFDFAINAQGVLFVAYTDIESVPANRVKVSYFNGNSWQDLAGYVDYIDGAAPKIDFYNQNVYVTYAFNGGSNTVQMFDYSSNTWTPVGNQYFELADFYDLDLAIDSNGTPYLAYVKNLNELVVKKMIGGTWQNVGGAVVTSNAFQKVNLKINNNIPYVCFLDASQSSSFTVLSFDGTSWSTLGSAGFSPSNSAYIEMDFKFSPDGTPYFSIAHQESSGDVCSVMKYVNANWEYAGQSAFTNPSYNSPNVSLSFIGNQNTPILAYTHNDFGMSRELSAMALCGTIDSIDVSICSGSYTSPSGNYNWNSTGVYSDTILNSQGCDSIITINLTIGLDTTVNQIDQNLSSNSTAPNTTYQWIDCSDNSPIPGATSQDYEAIALGEYAVIISNGNCTDTSACYEVTGFTHLEELISGLVKVYPNPAENIVNIEVSKWLDVDAMKIVNLQGQTMKHFNGLVNQVDISELSAGTYFLIISSEGNFIHKKITKQ